MYIHINVWITSTVFFLKKKAIYLEEKYMGGCERGTAITVVIIISQTFPYLFLIRTCFIFHCLSHFCLYRALVREEREEPALWLTTTHGVLPTVAGRHRSQGSDLPSHTECWPHWPAGTGAQHRFVFLTNDPSSGCSFILPETSFVDRVGRLSLLARAENTQVRWDDSQPPYAF